MTKKPLAVPSDETGSEKAPVHISEIGLPTAEVESKEVAPLGHNVPKSNFTLDTGFDEILRIRAEKKKLGREETAIKNRMKESYGLSKAAINLHISTVLLKDAADAESLYSDIKTINRLLAKGGQGVLDLIFSDDLPNLPVPKSPVSKRSA